MSKAISALSLVTVIVLFLLLGGTLVRVSSSQPRLDPGTAFTYQGYLTQGQQPADGSFELAFSLFDAPEGGAQVGATVFRTLTVNGGLFVAELDFGGVFDGAPLWLEIGVRPAGDTGPLTRLLPRQRLTAVPYASFATTAPWAGLDGVPGDFADNVDDDALLDLACLDGQLPKWQQPAGQWACADDLDTDTTYQPGAGLTLSTTTFALSPTFQLPQTCVPSETVKWDGSAWTCGTDNLSGEGAAWLLSGNAGTVPGADFLGTTDNLPLELGVNGSRVLRLEPGGTSPNVVAGYSANQVAGGVAGGVVAGGGRDLATNQVTADFATVGGGAANRGEGYAATTGGGEGNRAANSYATIGGGASNRATGTHAVVGGGQGNIVTGTHAIIAGGGFNRATVAYGTIGGGAGNVVSGTYATVSGGEKNGTTGDYAALGGGTYNHVIAAYGTIAGGGPSDTGNPLTSNNRVYDEYGTIGGGGGNVAGEDDGDPAAQHYATIGGGKDNTADETFATVSGGSGNAAEGYAATVGGGEGNSAGAILGSIYATVGGGAANSAGGGYSTVSGGRSNTAEGPYATLSGGYGNVITGAMGTIPGGLQNVVVAPYGFAAGSQARAEHQGAFVWADSSPAPFVSTGPDQFLVSAAGGVGIGTNAPSHMLTVAGDAAVRSRAVISAGAITSDNRLLQAPRALDAVGDLLYASGYATNTLSIWNVVDPESPALLGYTTFQLDGPVDLQVVGNRAYLASQNSNMLTILDVSDPADISHVGDSTQYLDYPQGLHVSGKYAYVASPGNDGRYDGLTIFDVTDAPAEIAATSFVTTHLEGTSDVFVLDSYAYVTSRDNNRLVVFDVSDPGQPTAVSYTGQALSQPVRVTVSGIYAYIVAEGANAVVVYDVSNPAQIAFLGQVTTAGTQLTHPRSIHVSGDRAYVAFAGDEGTGANGGLAVLDISDPAQATVLNVIGMSDSLRPYAVTGSGDRVYVANEGDDSVTIFDIAGLEATAVRAGELQAGNLEVAGYAAVEGDLGVRGGLNVGSGGALIQGALSVESTEASYIGGRLGIGPVATVITRSVGPTEWEELVLHHPTHPLDVDGEARFRVNDHNHLVLRSPNTSGDEDAYLEFVDFSYPDLITPSARIEFDAADPFTHTTGLRFYTQGAADAAMTERLRIDPDGDLLPAVSGDYSLGNTELRWAEVWTLGGLRQLSDGRYKENVSALSYGLEAVGALRPVAFAWRGDPAQETQYGFIAQEVRRVLPEVVTGSEDGEGGLSLDYSQLVPVLVRAIQEQQGELDTQTAQIAALEARLAALEAGQAGGAGAMNRFAPLGFGGLVLGAVALVGLRRKGGRP